MNEINYCLERPTANRLLANSNIFSNIDINTTPEEFDERIKAIANYQFDHGDYQQKTALIYAASCGNARLVEHIAQKGGSTTLNIGTEFGWSPIFCAVRCKDRKASLETTKVLVQLEADINLATTSGAVDYESGFEYIPEGLTPLSLAARWKDIKQVKLLLQKGAVERAYDTENEIVKIAKQKITGESLFINACFNDQGRVPLKAIIPTELLKEIFEYIQYG